MLRKLIYFSDFIIAPILSAILLTHSGFEIFAFALGALVWTFLENVIHRAAHRFKFMRKDHRFHHERPKEPSMPTIIYLFLLAALLLALSSLLFGTHFAAAFVAGVLSGYSFYMCVHYLIHNTQPREGTYLHRRKTYHDIHHKRWAKHFGVTTSVWDKLAERIKNASRT